MRMLLRAHSSSYSRNRTRAYVTGRLQVWPSPTSFSCSKRPFESSGRDLSSLTILFRRACSSLASKKCEALKSWTHPFHIQMFDHAHRTLASQSVDTRLMDSIISFTPGESLLTPHTTRSIERKSPTRAPGYFLCCAQPLIATPCRNLDGMEALSTVALSIPARLASSQLGGAVDTCAT